MLSKWLVRILTLFAIQAAFANYCFFHRGQTVITEEKATTCLLTASYREAACTEPENITQTGISDRRKGLPLCGVYWFNNGFHVVCLCDQSLCNTAKNAIKIIEKSLKNFTKAEKKFRRFLKLTGTPELISSSANTTRNRELLECLLRHLKRNEPVMINGGLRGLLFIAATGVFAVCCVIPPPVFRRQKSKMMDNDTSEKHQSAQRAALSQEDKNEK
ncbi:unnamed protein product [Cylicocyclus nassatus]|uniref:Uncharacterized protein n=1 Tax=Cylicocyclus nassatus TaxID=53992 RepID=A0AA36DPX6_CYLNA|nr:unnamed protein product [Cylicocyclus nassatus]